VKADLTVEVVGLVCGGNARNPKAQICSTPSNR
jgi:hypothetical protein